MPRIIQFATVFALTFVLAAYGAEDEELHPGKHPIGASWKYDFTNHRTGTRGTVTFVVQGHRTLAGRQMLVVSRNAHPPMYPSNHVLYDCDTDLWDVETGSYVACLLHGNQFLEEIAPHFGSFNFPLEVGRTWRSTYQYTDHVNDFTGEYWVERRVVAYQEIAVNGTTFMAYAVESTDTNSGYTESYWYAPEVGMIVQGNYDGIEYKLRTERMLTTGGTEVFLQSIQTLGKDCRGFRVNSEYEWAQVSGPAVDLADASAEIASFTAPSVDRETTLVFSLIMKCSNGVTVSDTVPIRVVPKTRERTLAALVDFLDVDASERPFTRDDIVALLDTNTDSLKNFISATSRGLIDVEFDILDWITVEKRRTDYYGDVVQDAVDAMSKAADLGTYDKVLPFVMPLEWGEPGCAAFLDPQIWHTSNGVFELGAAWLSGYDMVCVEKGRIAHEYGHTFGLVHSYAMNCDKEPPIPRSTIDPGDRNDSCFQKWCLDDTCSVTEPLDAAPIVNYDFDMLGGDHTDRYENYFPIHFHATWQALAGWLTEAQVLTPAVSGEYWLTALESLTPTPKAIRVSLGPDHTGSPQFYWLETREFNSSCQVDVRLEAAAVYSATGNLSPNTFPLHLETRKNTYFLYQGGFGFVDETGWFHFDPDAAASVIRPGKPLWDPYRGLRMEVLDCVERGPGAAVKVGIDFTRLNVDPPIVADFQTNGTAAITLTNDDSVPIEIGSASIGGRHPAAFAITSDECSSGTLQPGAYCVVTVRHIPTDRSDDNSDDSYNLGVLKVPNSAPLRPEVTVSLLGGT